MRVPQWLVSALGIQHQSQPRPSIDSHEDQAGSRIAIIGAGIAAASTAASLSSARNDSLHITVFERESAVGGRILSTPHSMGYYAALEHGAAYIATDDTCVIDLAHRAGLQHGAETRSGLRYGGSGAGFPIRFGATTSASCSLESQDWRHVLDLNWKFGLSFWRARQLVQSLAAAWSTHNATHHPLAGFTDPEWFMPADQYFAQKHISADLTHDVLNSCTKARTYRHVDDTTALSSLLATRSTTRAGIVGGNQQMVQESLTRSGLDLLLSTTVLRVGSGRHRAYSVQYMSPQHHTAQRSEFDIIIITSPLGTSQIQFDLPEKDDILQAFIPYEARHVTYVATSQDISHSPQYEYLDVIEKSDNVLTSGHPSQVDIDTIDSRTKFGKIHCLPGDELECDQLEFERIYRIISRKELTDWDVVDLIEPIIGSDRDEGKDVNITAAMHDSGISLVRRYAWPHALPRLSEDRRMPLDVELAPKLFYTAAFEHVMSSMEMSCRAGRHVAAQVLDVLAGER